VQDVSSFHTCCPSVSLTVKSSLKTSYFRSPNTYTYIVLVYIAEYTINQGVSPTLLFPIEDTPFTEYRQFYPMYAFLYQLGVFISRSSVSFIRIHNLYLPSLLQVANLILLLAVCPLPPFPLRLSAQTQTEANTPIQHSLTPFLSIYPLFALILWEGLLGGAVYVNTFAEIMSTVPDADREFSLGATSVSDSGGICVASLIGMAIEGRLCEWNVQHGRSWCRSLGGGKAG
jgi:battenin